MIEKAIAVYVDADDRIISEFSWLWKTWKYHKLNEEYDLVVYHHPDAEERLSVFKGIIKIEMPSIRMADDYIFLKSHYFCMDEWSNPLTKYKYLMKTDCDVFLTERLKGYSPKKLLVGQGSYYDPSDTLKYNFIKGIADEFDFKYRGMTNIGDSFFGKTKHVLSSVICQALLTEHLLNTKFKKNQICPESGFNKGIASMIAGEVTINSIFSAQTVLLYALDYMCWESDEICSDTLHIHAWHTGKKFSKHAFLKGEYNDWVVDEKDMYKDAASYCQFFATLPIENL